MKLLDPFVNDKGFTLIEMMVTVAVLAVLLALAAPSFATMMRAQRVRTLAADLYNDVVFARSEAIKRNTVVLITPKDLSATNKDWAKGWDVGTNQMVGTLLTPITLKSRTEEAGGVTATGVDAALSYGGAGRLTGVAAAQAITISHPDIAVTDKRCVAVDFTGRGSLKSGAC